MFVSFFVCCFVLENHGAPGECFDWLVGCLIGRFVRFVCLVGLVCLFVLEAGWLVSRLVDWLVK